MRPERSQALRELFLGAEHLAVMHMRASRRQKTRRGISLCDSLDMSQRQLLRRSIRLPVSFDRCIPGIAADFSPGGFRAEVTVALAPGSRVIGYFLVGQSEVEFQGTVTWNRPGNPGESFSGQVGIRFDELPKQLQVMLGTKQRHAAAA